MKVNDRHLCIACMKELNKREICDCCGFEQASYKMIPRCLIPGTHLSNRYMIGKVLGEGSFGITYIGYDEILDLPVAIKEYYPSDLVSRDVIRGKDTNVYMFSDIEQEEYDNRLQKFLREARSLARFNQLNAVVSVRDYFLENNTAYIVMDYVHGESLKKVVKDKGPLSVNETLRIFQPILLSLDKIHETGIIHRDISPDNLLYDGEDLTLIDFGAAELQNAELTRSITIMFKRGFSPEEQYRLKGKQGPWTDVYALSASMYYAMTGLVPDEAIQRTLDDNVIPLKDMKQLKIPDIISEGIMKGMEIQGKNRYQSVKALYESIYDDDKKYMSFHETEKKLVGDTSKKRWGVAVAIVVLFLLIISVGMLRLREAGKQGSGNTIQTSTMQVSTRDIQASTQETATEKKIERTTEQKTEAATEKTTKESTKKKPSKTSSGNSSSTYQPQQETTSAPSTQAPLTTQAPATTQAPMQPTTAPVVEATTAAPVTEAPTTQGPFDGYID